MKIIIVVVCRAIVAIAHITFLWFSAVIVMTLRSSQLRRRWTVHMELAAGTATVATVNYHPRSGMN